ncbi:alpha/beta fold hydrolase [Nocardioides sp. dk4132]|uniref:alpha/beta fold hydrolase n=1 Tax=unclassified Nocardioides TaxID=2615069 RepID=UPI0012961331|nr:MULTISPECIES: alpha/beta fold hydrolase [unclassified Nocardioides]MQW77592.1 alpha/beta fold hydrolase [Nocardioides sp. dk4132]QGA06120.1 alpha/beta fold hydrolase [Nocardioides sp. dk884]
MTVTEKPPVVLVHGMGSTFEHNWRRHGWVDMLEAEGRAVVGFDLPGHGRSPGLTDATDTGVGRLLQLCESYGEVDLVAFSAGSVLSLSAAVRRPELFRRLVFLGLADTQLRVTRESMRAGANDLDSPVMRSVRRAAERAGNDVATVLDWARRAEAPPRFADLARVTAPVLLVLGERDFLGEPDELLASLPQAQLVTLRDTDHFATTSQFEAKLVVLDFLMA